MSRIEQYVDKDGNVDLDRMYSDAIADLVVVVTVWADTDGDDEDTGLTKEEAVVEHACTIMEDVEDGVA